MADISGGTINSSGNGIAALISAIASTTSTRLLSTPSIMTLNNQEAEIVVAQNVPFVTGSFAQVGNPPMWTIRSRPLNDRTWASR
ncbi:hypothetical protein [Sulfitobacter aestuariivivens]|uniref:hypothetical protein n=1 Tax=Sulfitobacter aestuariivivens TaxID=2766981 RepID=UPI0036231A86